MAHSSASWLRRLFVAIDANFRLKRKKVSSDALDPSLNHGYAYVVEEKAYKQHLATHDTLPTESADHCNNHFWTQLWNEGRCPETWGNGASAEIKQEYYEYLYKLFPDLQLGPGRTQLES